MRIVKKATLVLSLFSFLSTAKAETLVVTTTDDDASVAFTNCNTTGDTTSGTCSIRGALSTAVDGDVIELDTATYCISSDSIYVEKAVTLRGQGMDQTILDGGNAASSSSLCISSPSTNTILRVAADAISFHLEGLTIKGGATTGGGGGIYISSTGVVLTKIKITENTTSGSGGGIYINSGDTSIEESIIDLNSTTSTDSSTGGGGISVRGGDLIITRSIIANNTCDARNGGGIHIRSDSSNVTITNSTISGNQSTETSFGRGAGINMSAVGSGNPHLYIQNTTILGNTVSSSTPSSGGGIYVSSGTLSVVSSVIAGNSSGTTSVSDCKIETAATFTTLGYNFIPSSTCNYTPDGSTDISGASFTSSVLETTLVDNGGPTKTHAIPTGSPLINAGDCSSSGVTADQRGYYRNDGSCDIGAYEFGATSFCGDNISDALEECDDGNDDNTDACIDTCENASCGDGYTQTSSEECDDGNTVDGDGCSSTCTDEVVFDGDGDGYLNDGTDCDDSDATIYPGAEESCNEKDDDCDGEIDEAGTTIGAFSWCLDSDGDGYGDTNDSCTKTACSQPDGYASGNTDCDDTDPLINVAATEVADDGVDQNCDNFDNPDNDGDGYYDDDCDDTNASINPDATEIQDNDVDENCDPSDDLSGGSGGSSTGGTGSTGGTSGSESTSGSTDGGATGTDPNQLQADGGGGGCSFQAY